MIDWAAHRKHREQIIADAGQWIGLLDADGNPLMDLPCGIHGGAGGTQRPRLPGTYGIVPQ